MSLRSLSIVRLLPSAIALLALGGWALTNAAYTNSALHTAQQPPVADIGQQVHDYILAHPEAIQEAQKILVKRQKEALQASVKAALPENRAAVFSDPADPVLGNASGDVTLVAVTDYSCPYCKAITPNLEALLAADPGVRLVVKEYPILGPESEMAAKLALAALKQGGGKYAAFHAALMADKTPEHQLTEAHILEIAGRVPLDVGRLRQDAAAPEIAAKIAANRGLALKLAITGTPALIVGDKITGGAMSLDALKAVVAEARGTK